GDRARPWRTKQQASAARPSPRSGTCDSCRRSTAARGNRSAESPHPPPPLPAAACNGRGPRSPCRRLSVLPFRNPLAICSCEQDVALLCCLQHRLGTLRVARELVDAPLDFRTEVPDEALNGP